MTGKGHKKTRSKLLSVKCTISEIEVSGMGLIADYTAEGKCSVLDTATQKIQNKICRLETLREEYRHVLRKFQAPDPLKAGVP